MEAVLCEIANGVGPWVRCEVCEGPLRDSGEFVLLREVKEVGYWYRYLHRDCYRGDSLVPWEVFRKKVVG